jgi:hypothetical protein
VVEVDVAKGHAIAASSALKETVPNSNERHAAVVAGGTGADEGGFVGVA